MREEDGRESWWSRWCGWVVLAAGIVVVAIVFVFCDVERRRQESAHEARCMRARAEILECLERENPRDGWLVCPEKAKFKYMCTSWPSSWGGSR